VLGSEAGGQAAAVLYTVVLTCKHLGIDPFAYLREALPGLFAQCETPAASSCWIGCLIGGCGGVSGTHREGRRQPGKQAVNDSTVGRPAEPR
jgi:hypothetical protein